MFLQEVEGKDPRQKGIWKLPTNLGVQGSHNPCFCPETDQTDIEPENKMKRHVKLLKQSMDTCVKFSWKKETYFSSIMGNREICPR